LRAIVIELPGVLAAHQLVSERPIVRARYIDIRGAISP